MRTVTLSGGSGSISLQKGLYHFRGMNCDSIINLYDDGKSTGLVRRICNVLGPSDMRKLHNTKYELLRNPNPRLIDLYNLRATGTTHQLTKIIEEYIDRIGPSRFTSLCQAGFEEYLSHDRSESIHEDFAIMNAIYAGLFSKLGIKDTEWLITEALQLDARVYCNSENNCHLRAATESGEILRSESEITSHNSCDKIIDVWLEDSDGNKCSPELDNDTKNVMLNADIIISSAGTQWSSLIPTYLTRGFNDAYNDSHAKKYVVLNVSDDGDTRGYKTQDFYDLIVKFLDGDYVVVTHEPIEANHRQLVNPHIKTESGHNSTELAETILYDYFSQKIQSKNLIVSDFDHTLFDQNLPEISKSNVDMFSRLPNKTLTSGNTIEHIIEKISNPVFPIFYNNGMYYRFPDGQICVDDNAILDSNLVEQALRVINTLREQNPDIPLPEIIFHVAHILLLRFKNVSDRSHIVALFQSVLPQGLQVAERGSTSIEIWKSNISKRSFFQKHFVHDNQVLYLGDEPHGNDKEFFMAYESICINNIKETETFLKFVLEKL